MRNYILGVVDVAAERKSSFFPYFTDIFDSRRPRILHALHDWPDKTCHQILSNMVLAMKRGYSKVLINENVIPEPGAHWETTSLDFVMMTVGSNERTEENWMRLVESAGLKVVKIWTAQNGVESLIECELP